MTLNPTSAPAATFRTAAMARGRGSLFAPTPRASL
jgi:hypothetical protein